MRHHYSTTTIIIIIISILSSMPHAVSTVFRLNGRPRAIVRRRLTATPPPAARPGRLTAGRWEAVVVVGNDVVDRIVR